jgi:predicted methyltransferase
MLDKQRVEDAPFLIDGRFESAYHSLGAVTMVLFYHDTVWLAMNREAMNKAVFGALKPGRVFLIVDHSARAGDGTNVAATLHRIEEDVVKTEVQAAGFVLDGEADFLCNSDDSRDWNDSPSAAGDRRGTSDRFVLRFRKP